MSNVSANVIQSMFNHLTASYSESEARDILVQKYPDSESMIKEFKVDGLRTTVVEMGKVKSVSDPATIETAPSAVDLKTAVKAKVAKPKAEKPAKKASKVDQARELYLNAKDQSRAAMIAVFQEKLGMSKAMASTYFYSCKA